MNCMQNYHLIWRMHIWYNRAKEEYALCQILYTNKICWFDLTSCSWFNSVFLIFSSCMIIANKSYKLLHMKNEIMMMTKERNENIYLVVYFYYLTFKIYQTFKQNRNSNKCFLHMLTYTVSYHEITTVFQI